MPAFPDVFTHLDLASRHILDLQEQEGLDPEITINVQLKIGELAVSSGLLTERQLQTILGNVIHLKPLADSLGSAVA